MGTEKFTKDYTKKCTENINQNQKPANKSGGELNLLDLLTYLHMALIFNHIGNSKNVFIYSSWPRLWHRSLSLMHDFSILFWIQCVV